MKQNANRGCGLTAGYNAPRSSREVRNTQAMAAWPCREPLWVGALWMRLSMPRRQFVRIPCTFCRTVSPHFLACDCRHKGFVPSWRFMSTQTSLSGNRSGGQQLESLLRRSDTFIGSEKAVIWLNGKLPGGQSRPCWQGSHPASRQLRCGIAEIALAAVAVRTLLLSLADTHPHRTRSRQQQAKP